MSFTGGVGVSDFGFFHAHGGFGIQPGGDVAVVSSRVAVNANHHISAGLADHFALVLKAAEVHDHVVAGLELHSETTPSGSS